MNSYIQHHVQAALQSLGRITRVPLTSLMIFTVLGIALALPTVLFVLIENAHSLNKQWDKHSPIMLYLKTSANEAQELARTLRTQPEIKNVEYISPEQGLMEFQKDSVLGEVLNTLAKNPLPPVLVITPQQDWQTPHMIEILLSRLKHLPQVEMAELDLAWVQRLDALLELSKQVGFAFSILLSVGVIFIIGSIIHLATQSHRDEIIIYQLVGATNAFIRRPFLYTGMWYGLLGGVIAWGLVTAFMIGISAPSEALARLYGSNFSVQGLSVNASMMLLLLGVGLGWLGSWIAVYRQVSPA